MSHVNADHLDYFKFVGRIVGKAIADGQALDAHFTQSFYKVPRGLGYARAGCAQFAMFLAGRPNPYHAVSSRFKSAYYARVAVCQLWEVWKYSGTLCATRGALLSYHLLVVSGR